MQNYICEGERIQVTAPSGGITSGNVVLVGAKVTVAITSAIEGKIAVCQTEGVFELPKATGAITKGDALYFDESENELTKTSTGNALAGYAFTSALSGDTTVQISLCCGVASVAGTVAASTASTTGGVVADLNLVIAALKAAGIMASE